MSDIKKNLFVECREEMGDKYLPKVKKKEWSNEIFIIYEKNGEIYEYSGDTDVIFNTNNKLCLYSGELDDKKTPHGHGKITFCDKSITGKFYRGLPMDSSAILETKNYVAIANILGYEIIKFEHIRYKKK